MEISTLPVSDVNCFPLTCRIEAFNSLFGQHMRSNRLDQIPIADIEDVINRGAGSTYSSADVLLLLEVHLLRLSLSLSLLKQGAFSSISYIFIELS